ncbi:MAG TPA: VOC family protein, partial [Candidatus Rubrimentiphilum sp.]|nr:VOC family protein [Candidatus Rubrimentiphilum sp.]
DHVQLAMPAGREAEARDFYVNVLGMSEIPKPSEKAVRGGVWFRSGTVQLHLGVDPDFHPAQKAHPALRCADFPALVKRLQDANISVQIETESNRRSAYVHDPFGNRIELIG